MAKTETVRARVEPELKRDAEAALGRCEPSGKRGGRVPIDKHPVGGMVSQDGIEPGEDAGCLRGVAVRSDAEVHRRRCDGEVVEEYLRQQRVVMLACVDDHVLVAVLPQRLVDRRQLHKLRSRSHDAQHLHVPPRASQ